MAQKKSLVTGPVGPQQEEMVVVVVKFKGGPESMQKGFDAVNNAILALGASQPLQAVQRHTSQLGQSTPLFGGSVVEAEVVEPAPETAETQSAQQPAATQVDKPKREVRKYTFLPNFDVNPTSMPLKQFLGTKEYTENDKYLVVSLWLMKYGGADPFTPDHVFTCFRAMDWKQQVDFTQPIRLMKSKKSFFENPAKGSWRLTAGVGVPAAEAALAKS